MYDAILIPGGGTDQSGQLHPWVKARFDQAFAHNHETKYYIPLSRGTVYKQTPYIESEVGTQYLIQHGIIPSRIIAETQSLDTIGNAYFARIMCDLHRCYNLLVITSAFHLPRVKTIFNWVFSLSSHHYTLAYESVSDNTVPKNILYVRQQKETTSLQLLTTLIPTIQTLPQLKTWLFTQHTAYNGSTNTRQLPPDLCASY